MYIKQVIIQGFRSYRDQTVIEPFSPKHNVIIGRNGSGKSNFFFAIQFVLSDEFSNMRPEERQQLLHEGTGPRVVSAFVEIIFDNSDSRIPIERDEVSVRRVIGAKKDSYYLDKKHVTKVDVMNLLESAGFSRSNPYYIVKQGKINQLALSPDAQRLKLLREVAGTRVFDERKEESRTILKEANAKREKIDEMIGYIEERLQSLEEEKEELRSYTDWDKQRRSIEYTIHDKELRDTRKKLEDLEGERQGKEQGSWEKQKEVAEAQAEIEVVERQLKETQVAVQALSSEKQQLQDEDEELIKRRAKLEFDVRDLRDRVADDHQSKERLQQELAGLEVTVGERQTELDAILPRYQRHKEQEEQLNLQLKECEQRRTELFAKQGRGQQFSSTEERDAWINKEVESLSESISTKERQIARLSQDVQLLKEKTAKQERDVQERGEGVEQRRAAIEKTSREHTHLKRKRDDLHNRRRELWKREGAIDQALLSAKDQLSKAERNRVMGIGKLVASGLDSMNKVVEEKQLSGVYGPLIEHFECPQKLFTAVGITAAGRLFYVVVDTADTAGTILSHMHRQKLPGMVNFLPLSTLRCHIPDYPNSPDALPMLKELTYDPMYEPAMKEVFGKTLICRDIDMASYFAKNANMDSITMEGDQVSRRGTLMGGYYDLKSSRMDTQRLVKMHRESVEKAKGEKADLQQEIEELDGEITHVLSEIQRMETKRIQLIESMERQKMDGKALSNELQANRKALEPKERSLAKQENDLQSMQRQLGALQAELGTELLSQLDPDDKMEVGSLSEEIQSLQQRLRTSLKQRTKLESEKNTLENILFSNLLPRKEELQQDLEEVTVSDARQQLEMQSEEFEHLCANIAHNRSQLEEIEAAFDNHTRKTKELELSLDKWKTIEKGHQEVINEKAKKMEEMANQRSLLFKKKEDSMRKIRELGSLPSDAFDKFHGLALSQLWKKLRKCNAELKKYSHVNKKALEQFVNFSERRERLGSRRDQLDRDYQAIIELMDVLEQRKHEAIQFMFKQVSKYFSEVFKELVPEGKALLIMKRSVDAEPPAASSSAGEEDTDDGGATAASGSSAGAEPPDMYTGIAIKVSFTDVTADTKELQQLSGGQKSLVALALIFAIQKCDPAPFYLFDEIDQALDPEHRLSVAGLIHRLADNAQFITTTFRPELLEKADKFYGVKFQNKVSHIHVVSQEAARGFIEKESSTADK